MAATFEYFPDVDVFMSNRVLLADRLIQRQSPGFLYLSDYQSVVRRVYFFLLWYGKNLSFLGFFFNFMDRSYDGDDKFPLMQSN